MTTTFDKRARGDAAEADACTHLQQHGLRLLARNVSYRFGELDLVMADGGTLVFVEVRLRRSGPFGDGALSVDAKKRRRIVLAARAWLAARPWLGDAPCRFDVVSVEVVATGETTMRWIRDAFRLGA
jgi:putative endonuclease